MNELKKIYRVFYGQFLESLMNKRVWVGYIIGISVILKSAYLFCGYAGERVFQIWEPYLTCFINVGNITLILIGFIVIISDAPFVNHRSLLTLYRISRKQWFWGMSIYILCHAFLYNLVIVGASMLYCSQQGFINNIWSRTLYNLANFPSANAIEQWQMPIIDCLLIDN